jgi:hypothetical protein
MKGEAGFTLIEALSAGIISLVVAGAIFSIVYLTNDQIREGTTELRLQERQYVVSEQIRRFTRSAAGARRSDEDSATVYDQDNAFPPIVLPLTGRLPEVRFFGRDYLLDGGYKLGRNYLMEGTPIAGGHALSYKAFTIGMDTVYLDSASSYFRILPNRQGIIADLKLIALSGGTPVELPHDSELVLCRNRD